MLLTDKEVKVLELLKQGKSQKEIAVILDVSAPAVTHFKQSAIKKIEHARITAKRATDLGFVILLAAFFLTLSPLVSAVVPDPGHPAYTVGPGDNGSFYPGNYTFPNNLYVSNLFGVGDTNPTEMFVVGNGDLFQVTSAGSARLPDGSNTSAALSFTIDTDTGLYRVTTNQLGFTTGGTQRVVINSTGLSVTNGGRLAAAEMCLNGDCRTSWTTDGIWANTSGNATFTAGNVGIGTTTPSEKLTVQNGTVLVTAPSTMRARGNISNLNPSPIYIINDIQAVGDYLYIADGWFNWSIVDISDPDTPRRVVMRDVSGPRSIHAVGTTLYVGTGGGLNVYNIQNPMNPVQTGTVSIGGEITRMISAGQYLYGIGSNGSNISLTILDVVNNTNPRVVGSIVLGDSAGGAAVHGLDVQGDVAYIATGLNFYLINITNSTNPRILANYSDFYVSDVIVRGGYAYAGGWGNGFHIFDVTNTSNIVRTDNYNTGYLLDIVLAGNYIYGASNLNRTTVLDVSDPYNIIEVGHLQLNSLPGRIDLQGRYLYIATTQATEIFEIPGIDTPSAQLGSVEAGSATITNDLQVIGTTTLHSGLTVGERGIRTAGSASIAQNLFVDGKANITGITYTPQLCLNGDCQSSWPAATIGTEVAVQNDGTATRLGKIDALLAGDSNSALNEVFVSGTYAYLADSWLNLSIIDISDPRDPERLAMVDISGARGVYESGEYLFTMNSGTVYIYKVQNPSQPELVHSFSPAGGSITMTEIAVQGTRLYLAIQGATNNSLMTYDLTNITNPIRMSWINISQDNAPYELEVQRELVYMVSPEGLNIVNVTDPRNPRNIGLYYETIGDFATQVYDLKVRGRYVYLASYWHGLIVVDVSNPTAPTRVNSPVEYQEHGITIEIVGDYAYVGADQYGGATLNRTIVYDITNASNTTIVGAISLESYPTSSEVSGRYLFMAGQNEMRIYEIPGVSAPGANIGSIRTDSLFVNEKISVAGSADIYGGVSVGNDGLRSDGLISAGNGLTVAGVLNASGPIYAQSIDGITVQIRANGSTALRIDSDRSATFFNRTGGVLATFNATASTVRIGSSNTNVSLLVNGSINATGAVTGSAGFDLAEMFNAAETMGPGDLVIAVDENSVRKATQADADLVIGAVSTQPGFILANQNIANPVLIGLAGRIPVKVSGTVQRGDFITISSTPGIGEAAREPGFVIGRAIGNVRADGTVMIIIQPAYFSPQVTVTNELVGGKAGKTFATGLVVQESRGNGQGIENRGQDRVVALGTQEDVVVTLG